jgi:hypothetical protein
VAQSSSKTVAAAAAVAAQCTVKPQLASGNCVQGRQWAVPLKRGSWSHSGQQQLRRVKYASQCLMAWHDYELSGQQWLTGRS